MGPKIKSTIGCFETKHACNFVLGKCFATN